MKHIYTSIQAGITRQSSASALGTAFSGKIFSLLLLSFFLLVSGEGYGETFTSRTSGSWHIASTWTKSSTGGVDTPGPNDEVVILHNHKITVNATINAVCKNLELRAINGNTGSQSAITIENTGTLTVDEITFNTTHQNFGATVINNGYLKFKSFSYGNVTKSDHVFLTNNQTNSTVEYIGTNQSVLPVSYRNLTLSGSGNKTVSAGLNVSGDLTINSGSTFIAGNYTHTISGNFNNNGNFNTDNSTIVMNGADKSILSSGVASTFSNLTLTGGNKSLLSDINVAGTLVLTSAILNTTKEFNVSLLPAASLGFDETAAQHIIGQVVTSPRILSANSSETFGNIGISITSGSADLGEVTVLRTTGTAINADNSESVKRQYLVTNTSARTSAGTKITLKYYSHDLGDPTEAIFDLYRFNEQNLTRIAYHVPYESIEVTSESVTGMYTIFSTQINPLPVELITFKAQRDTRGVKLTWATASELENKGFEVQASNNGRDFMAIGFVESKVGTTTLRQDYNFLDTKAVSGTRYYRLKQLDFDGTASYSPIKAYTLDASNGKVSAYPNPFDEAVVVTLNGTEVRDVQVVLMDAMGKVLQQRTEQTSGNSITVDMHSVATKGMYVLHVLDNDTKHIFKLMKR